MQGQVQKSKPLSKANERLPWAVWPEKEGLSLLLGPHTLPGPQQHLAQLEAPAYRDSPVLPVDVELEFKALDLETGVLGEQGQLLCYTDSVVPSWSLGHTEGSLGHLVEL